jgi:amino acid transporter
LEIGGSIGVPFYLAQSVSVAFYVIGFAESLEFVGFHAWVEDIVPGWSRTATSSGTLLILFLIAWCGADLAVKTQYLIMTLLAVALGSFFAGYTPVLAPELNYAAGYTDGQSFWTVFAIFFPAVTGIMAGVSMSGDLRNPARSIPLGTIYAVLLTFGVYAAQMISLAHNATRQELVENKMIMERVATIGPAILVGLWAATLSSALTSLLAAPRTLQALAGDRVVPRSLGRRHGRRKEPRVALLVTFLLAEGCLLAGELDVIAPVITMFFLTTYGMVNLVAGVERLVSNPSYRPTFKVHWIPSFLGGAGCLAVMFILNAKATLVAIVFCFMVYSLLQRRRYQTAWGDVRSGLWFAVTRLGLLRLTASRMHVHNWRPVILVLVGNPKTRLQLVNFARGFEAQRGLLFLAQILTGNWQKLLRMRGSRQKAIEDFIQQNRLSAVAKTVLTDDFEEGAITLLQVTGVGTLQPNTVLMGWSDDAVKQAAFGRTVRRILELERNLLIYSEAKSSEDDLRPRIDVWWRARENGSLMLTLAHLLRSSGRWRDHSLRVLRIIPEEAGREKTEAAMQSMIQSSRIPAECKIIVSATTPLTVIAAYSTRSEVCFIGMTVQPQEGSDQLLARYVPLVSTLKGHVFLTKSWHDLEL